MNNRFKRGSAVYTCAICGKRTRETGSSESFVELCVYCYHVGGIQNSYADKQITLEEFVAEVWSLRKQYNHPGVHSDLEV
jgi:hypothetical protein